MTGCPEIRPALGAYALGALDPDERERVASHVAACTACAAELAELTGTVRMLGVVTAEDIAIAADPPPEELFNRIVTASAHRRRRRRWRWAVGVAAAAAVLIGIGVFRITGDGGGAPVPGVAATPTVSASSTATNVAASLKSWPDAGGTRVAVSVSGVPSGTKCSLDAIAANGARETAATWQYAAGKHDYPGGSAEYMGTTSLRPDEISRFEIVTADGELLLVIPA